MFRLIGIPDLFYVIVPIIMIILVNLKLSNITRSIVEWHKYNPFEKDIVVMRNETIEQTFSGFLFYWIKADAGRLSLILKQNEESEDFVYLLATDEFTSHNVERNYDILNSRNISQDTYLNPLIGKESFQFYFSNDYSLVSRVLLMHAEDHRFLIEELQNILDFDASINYRITVPRSDVNSIFFYFYSIMKKKTISYCFFGHSITDVLLVMDKPIHELTIESSLNDKINYLNNLLQNKLNLSRKGLIDFFSENFGVYFIDRFFFNYRLKSN